MSYSSYITWRDQPVPLNPDLTIVIPTYNESARIVPTIASIVAHLAIRPESFEIIVSDDGSTDGTPDLVRNMGMRNVIVLAPGINRGKGAAVRAGVAASGGRLILFSDADLSTPIREIDAIIDAADSADVVIGSRGTVGSEEAEKSTIRRLTSWGARKVTHLGLGLDLADTQCGFKLFRRDAAMALFSVQRVDGFSFDAEILFLARRLDFSIHEVPIRWIDAPGSTVDPFRTALNFLVDVVRIRLRALIGRYPRVRPARCDATLERGLRLAVVTALPPSTATLTEYGHHLVRHLADKPEVSELIVLADDRDGLPKSSDAYCVVAAWRFDSWSTPWRLWRAVGRTRPDVVLFNAHFSSFGIRRVPAALGLCMPALLRLRGVRTVVLLHNIVEKVDLSAAGYGNSPARLRALSALGRVMTKVVLRADWVATTMPSFVETLRESYGAQNVSLTPHGTFETPLAPADETVDGRRRILAFGKFGTYKRIEDLLDAHRILLDRGGFDDVEVVIAGTDNPGAAGYLESAALDYADLPGVRFTGYVHETDIADLFESASAVVFPYTATTGSSGPLHQAGCYARAVIAPRLGDLLELIQHEGYAAEPFEPGEPDSLADAIAAVLEDGEHRRELGRQNYAAAIGLPLADICDLHVGRALRLAS